MTFISPTTAWQNTMPYPAYGPYAAPYQHPYYYQQLQPYYAPPNVFTPAESHFVPAASELPTADQAPLPVQNMENATTALPKADKKKLDLFRETPLRYGGYLNEAGEAFNSIISKSAVRWSYHLTAVYVALDTVEKGLRGFLSKDGSRNDKLKNAGKEAVDAAIFQYFASYLVPAKIIEVGKKFMDKSVAKMAVSPLLKKWGPTAISLAAIPLIVSPIDHATHFMMNKVVRPWLGTPIHH